MLDIKWIRENPEALDRALADRGWMPDEGFVSPLREGWPNEVKSVEAAPTVDEKRKRAIRALIGIDKERRMLIEQVEAARQLRNTASREIARAKATGDAAAVERLMAEVAQHKQIEEQPREVEARLNKALAYLPNVPADDVPVGDDERANTEYRRWGQKPGLNDAKEHFAIGEALGQMDFRTAAKLSGSRFVVLKGGLARLERALGQFMLDLHVSEHGYTEVLPPLLVRDEVLYGTGQLPKFAEDQFHAPLISEMDARRYASALSDFANHDDLRRLARETGNPETSAVLDRYLRALEPPTREDVIDYYKTELARLLLAAHKKEAARLWLIPTAEVPLTNLVRESILDEDVLPLRFAALTPCFRSEAGAAGKDTRGMLRQHQFDKVELVSITAPETARDEHERMLVSAEEVMKRLDLHYRVVTLATGEMGFGASKTWDIEVWLPGQATYREISSCSLYGDFQARRMAARYRPKVGKGTRLVHTLNGSGVAVGRALIAVMETYQNPDGSVTVPDVLRPYMGGIAKIAG